MTRIAAFRNTNANNYDKDKHVAQLKGLIASKPKFYWIGVSKDDFLFDTVTKLRSSYDEVGLKYTYRKSEGSHPWKEWSLYLKSLLQSFSNSVHIYYW